MRIKLDRTGGFLTINSTGDQREVPNFLFIFPEPILNQNLPKTERLVTGSALEHRDGNLFRQRTVKRLGH